MLSDLVLSTITVCGGLSGVSHHEEELSKRLECTPIVVRIDSNFAHKVHGSFVEQPRPKSNRGRKKTVKQRERKRAGDGTCMASQITFTMRMPEDGHIYRVLLWRNGKVTLPGMVKSGAADARIVLRHLCDYLEPYLGHRPEVLYADVVMENYKCEIVGRELSMRRAQLLMQRILDGLININFEDLCAGVTNPVFTCAEISPAVAGWNAYFSAGREYTLDAAVMRNRLAQSSAVRHLYISESDLGRFCADETWLRAYATVRDWYAKYRFYVFAADAVLERVIYYMCLPALEQWHARLRSSKNNVLSHIKYDTEIHSALIWRFKAPTPADPDKLTTVKIFSRGSVNFSGASSRESAEHIRRTLNEFFAEHPEVFRDYRPNWDEPDPEFSSDSEAELDEVPVNNSVPKDVKQREYYSLYDRALCGRDSLLNRSAKAGENSLNKHVAREHEEKDRESKHHFEVNSAQRSADRVC